MTDIVQKVGKKFLVPKGWSLVSIGDLFKVTRGKVLPMGLVSPEFTHADPYPVYSSQTKKKGLAGFYSEYLYEDAITWTTDGANAGDVNFRPGKFYCTNVCGVLLNTHGHANACVASILNSVTRGYVSYVGNPKLMNDVMATINIPLPPLTEQRKIAEILRTWDEAIETAEAELKAKQERKRWMVDRLVGSLPGAKIFKMSDLFERVVRRNSNGCTMSLTISASAGLVDQREVFSRKIASTDTSKYFLVKKGEYAYNRSHSNGNPYGVIRRLSRYEEGIVSPIYLVFKARSEGVEPLYADMLFESGGLNKQLRKIAQEGARAHGLLNVTAEDFFSMKISLPALAMQRENAERLSVIGREIEINSELVNSLREQKRGLMQKLLTGEVRVAA
ncbi:putative type-1 restriction enzyme specificity protein MPN_289 [Verrucomicrobiota bacterium]|nr:putative type-1 restriction enzyme specificity protein MPN_289 [Verrucomicrobiota bacterium]